MQNGEDRRRLLLRRLWRSTPAPLRRFLMSRLHPRVNLGAIGVFFDPAGRVLVLRHVFRGRLDWALPGGFLKAGEAPEVGLARELREETGLACSTPELLRVVATRRFCELVYLAEVPSPQPLRPSLEIFEGRWCAAEALPDAMPEAQRDYVRAAVLRRPRKHGAGAPSVG